MLLSGALINVQFAGAFLGLGLALGIPLAIGQVYGGFCLRLSISIFERVFRAIPPLVLLFLFFFGPIHIFGAGISAMWAAVLAMGLRSAAYQSQIFRGAIQSIDAGQMTAARSLGMSRGKAVTSIILPQALRFSLPAWTNEYAIVLKDTAIIFAIGITEMMRRGRHIVAREFGYALLIYSAIAIIFLILVYVGTKLLSLLEERLRIPGHGTVEETGR